MMNRLKIRWKLTLWYGCALAVVLIVFGAAVFMITRDHLMQRIDRGLNEELADVLSEVNRAETEETLKDWLVRRFAAHAGFDFQITRPDGERFFYNLRIATKPWPLPKRVADLSAPVFETISTVESGQQRIVFVNAQGPDGPLTVQVGRSLTEYEHELNELLMTFLLAGPLTLLAAISGGYLLAWRVLRPVQEMTRAARDISADQLDRRIVVVNPHDELGELGATLNLMIERLDRSFAEMRRFTADAAHELRTPLAIIRSEAEVALRLPRSSEQYCGVLENLLEDANRLSVLADQLLFLSRQDAGLGSKATDRIRLDDLLGEVVGNMQIIAQEQEISLQLHECPPCELLSDARLLRRVLVNLLDNALKYAGRLGTVEVSTQIAARRVSVHIRDSGPGIAPEHVPHIFDRFYRIDAARSGEGNGAGLGLAICQSIVRGCGGAIDVESTLGEGTTFIVRLPRAIDAAN
jgi:two-component system heavy metal sensor histidine kinase CusS